MTGRSLTNFHPLQKTDDDSKEVAEKPKRGAPKKKVKICSILIPPYIMNNYCYFQTNDDDEKPKRKPAPKKKKVMHNSCRSSLFLNIDWAL